MSDSNPYAARILGRALIAEDTMAFEIERPAGFTFEAGQYVGIQLQNFQAPADGSDDGERMLSIASAPHDERLTVAMRMRDTAFKRQLAASAIGEQGAQVQLSPAMGDLVLPSDDARPIVMIAGGIGITPFYSMLRDLRQRRAQGETVPRVTLLNGNRSRAATVWHAELSTMARETDFLRVVHVIAEKGPAPDTDGGPCVTRNGLISADVIRQEVPDCKNALYYVVGPTAMVAAMQDGLDVCEVPFDQVFIEFFAGY